jgi:AraC-like DNA-binding protein
LTYFDSAFGSDDIGEAEQWMDAAYGRVDLDPRFQRYDERMRGDDRFFLTAARMDGTYSCLIDPDLFIVATATPGFRWMRGSEDGSLFDEPAIFQPHEPYSVVASNTEVHAVGFAMDALHRTARLLSGDDELEPKFDGSHAASRDSAAALLSALDLVHGHARAGLLSNDLFRSNVYRHIALRTLDSFRLVGDGHRLRVSAERRRSIYRLAADFLHDHASLPITVEDAAEAVGASVPELELAFGAHAPAEESPTVFLQGVRLDAALRDLQAGDPTLGNTVAEIAARWGFPSPSRFAAQFRAAYGVNPKSVLDR